MSRKKAVVVVLGDIGRSPRMCYHAYSLANQLNHDVTIVGYLDSTPHSVIKDNEHINIEPIPSPPPFGKAPESVQMLLKLIWASFVLLWTLLFRIGWTCDIILMQNPPAIPTASVCWIIARLKGALFIIDWHNYMYSILCDKYNMHDLIMKSYDIDEKESIKKKPDKGASIKKKKDKYEKMDSSKFRKWYIEKIYMLEGFFGRRADGGLCVTKAMQKDLLTSWQIPSAVFYDRPPSWKFGSNTEEEKHELFMKLGRDYQVFGVNDDNNSNNFTTMQNNRVIWKKDRPLILMSSTSWTPDEDFTILFEALGKYNDIARIAMRSVDSNRVPPILLVITGKGPMKDYYCEKVNRSGMEMVKVITPWLEAADYPKMLASSDLGVSLHTSTSGLDLPMKVVDMFGSGIPVLAKNFACISELVEVNKNGYLFDTAKELADHLLRLATGFPNHSKELTRLKQYVNNERLDTWEETWPTTVSPILTAPKNIPLERILARDSAFISD